MPREDGAKSKSQKAMGVMEKRRVNVPGLLSAKGVTWFSTSEMIWAAFRLGLASGLQATGNGEPASRYSIVLYRPSGRILHRIVLAPCTHVGGTLGIRRR